MLTPRVGGELLSVLRTGSLVSSPDRTGGIHTQGTMAVARGHGNLNGDGQDACRPLVLASPLRLGLFNCTTDIMSAVVHL